MFPVLRKVVSAGLVEELLVVRTMVELTVVQTPVELVVHQSSRSDLVQLLPAGEHY